MKKDIHPDYIETQVTCTCGAQFTTRSTATNKIIKRELVARGAEPDGRTLWKRDGTRYFRETVFRQEKVEAE